MASRQRLGRLEPGEVPDAYRRVGAIVELYAYAAPTGPVDPGTQLAKLREESPFAMQGSGSWTVRVPLVAERGAPATCEVAAQPTHAATAPVSARTAPPTPEARVEALAIAVRSIGSDNPAIPEPSSLRPASCTTERNVVTATGTFEGGRVRTRRESGRLDDYTRNAGAATPALERLPPPV